MPLPALPTNSRHSTSPVVSPSSVTATAPNGVRGHHSLSPLRAERPSGTTSQIVTPTGTGMVNGTTNGNIGAGAGSADSAANEREETLELVEGLVSDVTNTKSPRRQQTTSIPLRAVIDQDRISEAGDPALPTGQPAGRAGKSPRRHRRRGSQQIQGGK
ncbi:hypothetical protein VTN96DRAFT_1777 [Rasamsonia emersonii]